MIVELHIRHGTALIVYAVNRIVNNQEVWKLLPAWPLLEGPDVHTSDSLVAAAEQLAVIIDVPAFVPADTNNVCDGHTALLIETAYHTGGVADDPGLDIYHGWLDLDSEDPTEKKTFDSRKLDEGPQTQYPTR